MLSNGILFLAKIISEPVTMNIEKKEIRTKFKINDKKITALELHNFVKENVIQQSSGSQTPELQGDVDRVLVQFN